VTYPAEIESFVSAAERHAEAERVRAAAERLFRRLRRHHDDDAAYDMAGVNLADRRALAAAAAERVAMEALAISLVGAPTAERLAGAGVVVWHRREHEPANSNRPKRARRQVAE
jgi:hypothetical protein